MIKYTKNIIDKIQSFVKDKSLSICAILSPQGYGKLTIAQQFVIESKYKYRIVYSTPDNYNHLYSLATALNESSINYSSLYHKTIDFLNSNPSSVFIFNCCESYKEELVRIITEITTFYVNISVTTSKIIFLFLINDTHTSILLDKYFSKFSQYVEYINLEKWADSDLIEFFKVKYPTCYYEKEDLNHIIERSFSNPEDFISNLEELKQRGYFVRNKDDSWTLFKFDPEILNLRLARTVQERYEKLDANLKETIKKASIIGKEFDSETLKNPLKVIHAQQLLTQIEDISQLIHKTFPDNSLYCFENEEAHLSINEYVEEKDRQIWNMAIAQYFANEIKFKYTEISEQKTDELLRKAAFYFEKAEEYKISISYLMKLVSRCFTNDNYSQVIQLIDKINKYPGNYLSKQIRTILLVYNMESYEVLCEFDCALKEYFTYERYCYVKPDVLSWGIIKKAFYYYYNNNTLEAYKTLAFIKSKKELCTNINAKLYVDAYNMLSALGETLGYAEYVKFYNYALSLAKKFKLTNSYYSLLRKANTVHRGEIGIRMMERAYKYFFNNNKHMYAMTAHNIGTQYVLLLNGEKSIRYLKEAEFQFKELGNKGLLPTLNSIAVYYFVIKHDYNKALNILERLHSSDDFEQLALLNNKATCKRKLGCLNEVSIVIDQITDINNKFENQFRWYKECLILQNAYLYKALGQFEKALEYFTYYIQKGYGIIKENKISVIYNIIHLSKLLSRPLIPEIESVKNAYDKCGIYFYKHDLMIADLMFWE